MSWNKINYRNNMHGATIKNVLLQFKYSCLLISFFLLNPHCFLLLVDCVNFTPTGWNRSCFYSDLQSGLHTGRLSRI